MAAIHRYGAIVLAAVGGVAGGAWWGAARAQDSDPLAPFRDPAAAPETLLAALEDGRNRLGTDLSIATFRDGLTVLADGSPALRDHVHATARGARERCAEALRGWGLEPPAPFPLQYLVVVDVDSGPAGVVAWNPSLAVLRRRSGGGPVAAAAGAPAGPPSRPDGPPLARDLVAAARRTRDALRAHRPGGSTRTLERHLAEEALAAAPVGAGLPAWFRAGLSGALLARVEGEAVGAAHLPAGVTAESAAALASAATVPPEAAPLLTMAVSRAMEGRDAAAAKALVGAADAAAFEGTLGRPAAEFLRDAVAAAAAAGGPACDANATLPCPDCAGKGKLDVACLQCSGTSAVVCNSCRGDDGCWAGCDDGMRHYEGGRKLKCKFCSRGSVACKACRQGLSTTCLPCRGRVTVERPCLTCVKGRIPCATCARTDACALCAGKGSLPCPWCEGKPWDGPCTGCGGAGYEGCDGCFGNGKYPCTDCGATGTKTMVYSDGTTASSSTCDACKGVAQFPCKNCRNGRKDCDRCSGKGVSRRASADCPACAGGGSRPCACAPNAPAPSPGLTAEEGKALGTARDRAVQFLLKSRHHTGAFSLREEGSKDAAGALTDPTLFSNAQTLWVLLSAGCAPEDPAMKAALRVLRVQVAPVAEGKEKDAGVQATVFAFRALLAAGTPATDPAVHALVRAVEKAQRDSGLWCHGLDGSGSEENILDSLIAIEGLYVARSRGISINPSVWGKALRAGSKEFGGRGPTAMKTGRLSGIDVLSNLALIVFSKAGSLSEGAGAFDYASIPDVQVGLAWLDRHFSLTECPVLVKGGRRVQKGGGAYFAYVFALQRLANLLRLPEVGGESWYVTGARHILKLQRADGSFEETGPYAANWSVRSTSDALLFLIRATPPITESEGMK